MGGLAPADPIIICFTDHRLDYDPAVYAKSTVQYDWRFIKSLPVYVIWNSQLSGFDEQLSAIAQRAKPPVEYFLADTQRGGSAWWLPLDGDIAAYCQRKISFNRLRWGLHHLPWLPFQNKDMRRYLSETNLATRARSA